MADIYYINIEEAVGYEGYEKLMGVCAVGKREAVSKYRLEADQKRTVYGEVLARFMVAKKAGIRMKEIQVGRNAYGKPHVKDRSGIYYNISHSGKYVVCGLAAGSLGIDIEEVRPIDLDIAKSFFHPKEYDYIVSRETDQQIDSLYDFWTLKESYIKYLGVGLNKSLDSFYFNLAGPTIEFYSKENHPAYFYRYGIEDNYKLAVCVGSRPAHITLEPISLDEILFFLDGEC